jgi:hypothetical protein
MGLTGSQDSSVGIATSYDLDNRGVGIRFPVGSRIFSTTRRTDLLWGPTLPSIQWVPEASSPGVKIPKREADHSLPASDEVKKIWICTATPLTLSWHSA